MAIAKCISTFGKNVIGMRKMTNADKILHFLNNKNFPYCDDCLSKLCKIERRQTVNHVCNKIIKDKLIATNVRCHNCDKIKKTRLIRNDGTILPKRDIEPTVSTIKIQKTKISLVNIENKLSEDELKEFIKTHLENNGWTVNIAWGKKHGIDIDAYREKQRWIIEVKGCGSRSAMRVNYFISVLGELLQRMDDKNAKYSIAFPDMKQFRKLWNKLHSLAKEKTNISCLFVDQQGNVMEEQ